MEKKTILVVEDDTNQRALYEEELSDEGYEVMSAGDGKEALAKVAGQKPDLIVLDVNMPGMDGLDTLARLLESDAKIPVILNTAYASYRESFSSWSADAYVVKSSDLTELKATVARLLEEKSGSA